MIQYIKEEGEDRAGTKCDRNLPYSATDTQVGGDHYKLNVIQPIDYIMDNKLGWCEGNAVKYITRHRHKNGAQDIHKAIHYLNLLLEREYS